MRRPPKRAELLAWMVQECPQVMRIVLTGHPSSAVAIRAINEGSVFRFLTKPHDDLELVAAIRGALECKQEKEELLKSQRNLQALFDTIDDLLFVLDSDANIVHFNPIVESRLGYSAEEVAEMPALPLPTPETGQPAGNRNNVTHINGLVVLKLIGAVKKPGKRTLRRP